MDEDSDGGEVPDSPQLPERKKLRTQQSSTSARVQPLEVQSGSKDSKPGEYLTVSDQGRMLIISECREFTWTENGGERCRGQADSVKQPARRHCCGATQGQAAAGEHDEYVHLNMNIFHDLLQSTIGTKFMKLQGTTSAKGEKEQETKGKGTHTARAGREDDLPHAEERNGA